MRDDATANPVKNDPPDADLASMQRKVRFGFALAIACLAIVGVVSYLSVVRLNEDAAWVEHTHEVLSRLELLLTAVTDSETAERGYVITGDESYLEPSRNSANVADVQASRLRELTADNPVQQQRLASVVPLVSDRLATLQKVIELRRTSGYAAAQSEILAGKGKQFHDRIRGLIDQMKGTETSLLQERRRLADRSATTTREVIVGGGFLACGLVGLALWAIRRDFAGRTRADRALRDAKDQLANEQYVHPVEGLDHVETQPDAKREDQEAGHAEKQQRATLRDKTDDPVQDIEAVPDRVAFDLAKIPDLDRHLTHAQMGVAGQKLHFRGGGHRRIHRDQ